MKSNLLASRFPFSGTLTAHWFMPRRPANPERRREGTGGTVRPSGGPSKNKLKNLSNIDIPWRAASWNLHVGIETALRRRQQTTPTRRRSRERTRSGGEGRRARVEKKAGRQIVNGGGWRLNSYCHKLTDLAVGEEWAHGAGDVHRKVPKSNNNNNNSSENASINK